MIIIIRLKISCFVLSSLSDTAVNQSVILIHITKEEKWKLKNASMNIPWSSQVPDFTRVFSCTEQSVSNFLLQMVMQCLDSKATVAMSADQITYLHFEILTCPKFFLCCTSKRVTPSGSRNKSIPVPA